MTTALTSADDAVAVTGAALLSPLGDSVADVMAALDEQSSAIEPADDPELDGAGAATIADFDAGRYAAVRGMRVYNRTTQLAICAARRALDDARLDTEGDGGAEVGVVMASTFGHLGTLLEYDRSLVKNGVARTNPVLMPLGLPSAPGAATALAFRAKAFSITLADGAASSLDALGLAMRLLRAGRARACVVVSAFSVCRELSISAARAGRLAAPDDVRVFDAQSKGRAFGEGAAALVLERADCASARGARPQGFVCGHAASFARERAELSAALRRVGDAALRGAHVDPGKIALVSSGAGGAPDDDRAEARALLDLFEGSGSGPVVTAIKGNLGDAVDAGGLMQAVLALAALRAGRVAPIARLREPALPGLCYAREPQPLDGGRALVTATARTGACAALVLASAADV